jgi:hypothetical protein
LAVKNKSGWNGNEYTGKMDRMISGEQRYALHTVEKTQNLLLMVLFGEDMNIGMVEGIKGLGGVSTPPGPVTQPFTKGVEGRNSIVLEGSSSPAWLPKRGESGHWKARISLVAVLK